MVGGAAEIAAAIEVAAGLIVSPLVTTDFTGAVEAMCSEKAHVGALTTFNHMVVYTHGCAKVTVVSVSFGGT